MKIFYLDTNKFVLNDDDLNKYAEQNNKKQHCYGRFLVHNVAEKVFKIDDSSIEIVNKKPKFSCSNLQFSISHSENIVVVAFDKNPVGIDVEFMKDRNFKELFKRYGVDNDNKELFYKFWTEYEAKIKLQQEFKSKINLTLNNFMISVVGDFDENNFELIDFSTIF